MFRKDSYEGKPNTSKIIKYYPLNKKPNRDSHSSLYTHMFIEDSHLGIMPIAGRSENPRFAVKIDPPSQEVEEIIRMGLHTHHGEPCDITEAVCDFLDEAAHFLTYYGKKAYYEIIYFCSDENKNKIEGFVIENIPNHCLKEFMGIYWQFIPKKILKDSEEKWERFALLSKKDILILSIPKILGGVRKFKKVLSNLQWLSQCTIPEFAMKDMAIQQQTKGYDFSIYRKNQEIFLAKITRHLGWAARGTFTDISLEFYQIYRYLKFAKTKAILREYILHELNKTLKIIGDKTGFKAKIRLEGMPSAQDYDNYIRRLIDGSLQFSEVVKLTKI